MKKTSLKIAGGLSAVLLGSSLTLACNDGDLVDDGVGGADGSTGGADGAGGNDGSTGGNDNVGGQGGDGTGGSQPGAPQLTRAASFVVQNALNVNASAIGSDGKIYLAGATDTSAVTVAQTSGALALTVWRFNADGTPDTTFGDAGKLTSTILDPGTAYDILEWAPKKFAIVISGGAATGVALVQLDASVASETIGSTATPVKFGWETLTELNAALAVENAEVTAVCSAAGAGTAKTECDEASTTLAGGICNPATDGFAQDLCDDAVDECYEAIDTCRDAYPLVAAPAFSNRPGGYSSWGGAVDKSGTEPKIVVFAAGPPAKVTTGEQRWDSDRWVARVMADDFAADVMFNGGAALSHDCSGLELADNDHRGIVEANGTIVSAGYTNVIAFSAVDPRTRTSKGNHIMLIRVKPNGTLDADFGFSDDESVDFTPGQTHMNPFRNAGPTVGAGFAEAYGVAALSDGSYVTTGYGNSFWNVTPVSVDIVATRVKADGTGLLPAFGGKRVGDDVQFAGAFAVQSEADGIYATGQDRGRDIVALSDNRTVHAGLYDERAALVVVTADGKLDGVLEYAFPSNFFSVNLNAAGDQLVATSAAVAKVVGATPEASAYAKTLVAIVDFAVAE